MDVPPAAAVSDTVRSTVDGFSTPDTVATPRYSLDRVMVRARRHTPSTALAGISLDRLEVVTAPGGTADLLHGLRMQSGVTQVTGRQRSVRARRRPGRGAGLGGRWPHPLSRQL